MHTHQETRPVHRPRRDQPGGGRHPWIALAVVVAVAVLVVAGFFLLGGEADVDVDGGQVDVTPPAADVDVNPPDVDVEAPDISVDPGGLDVDEAPPADAEAGDDAN
jgi:hypothetical protein